MRKLYLSMLGIIVLVLLSAGFVQAQTNLLINGDIETIEPGFWSKLNGTTECIWATDTAAATFNSRRSFKIVKSAASADVIGWRSVNNANLLWHNATAGTYTFKFSAKTEGVNEDPADDDFKIGVRYTFYDASSALIGERLVAVNQSIGSTVWTDYEEALILAAVPEEVYAEIIMGKDATGTAWFDNVGFDKSPIGIFNGTAETPVGWLNWASSSGIGFANFVEDDSAHSGGYSVLLEENDNNDDEMVFYSVPVPAEEGKWYKIGVWVKTEGITTDSSRFATNVTPDRDNDRIGITFFFHKAPIETSFDLVGGDQFFYIDQRIGKENQGWTHYSVVAYAPEEAAGVSMRARFTSYPTGKVWYDDFSIEEIELHTNILTNADIETIEPNFWEKLNGDMECIWATDTAAATFNSRRSFKIVKSAASADVIGWRSVNNANLLWHNATAGTYTFKFSAKTEGVNEDPADDDFKIGVRYTFYDASSALIGERLVAVNQSIGSTVWTDYEEALILAAVPEEVYAEIIMGKDATGTAWFDNVGFDKSPIGIFNGTAETPVGWLNWASSSGIGFANFVEHDSAHSGGYSVLLEENDDNDDEMVFYSVPVPAEEGKWYLVSAWTKTEGISTKEGMFASNITPDRDNDLIGYTFFFHKAPIETSFDLVGGDQFFYIDQRPGNEKQGWTKLMVIQQAPEEAAGVSIRARFTSFPTGKVWYDDFSIQEVTIIPTSIEDFGNKGVNIATEYMLQNNYPNPFNPITHIEYYVPQAGNISLVVYNITGQKVRTIIEAQHTKGVFHALWDGRDDSGNMVSSGIYFYQLKGNDAVITKKMTFLK